MPVDYRNPLDNLKVLALQLEPVPTPQLPAKVSRKFKPANIDWEKINAGVARTVVVDQPVSSEVVSVSGELTELTSLALQEARTILEMKLNVEDENFGVILRGKVSMIDRILTTQTKVDENHLKARSDNKLGALLDKLLEADRRINPVETSPDQDQ